MPLPVDTPVNSSVQPSIQPVILTIDQTTSLFRSEPDALVITLPVGYELVASRYFRHTPPNYDDIEYAINYIEDEIEKVVRQIPAVNAELVTEVGFIRRIALLCGCPDEPHIHLGRDVLERLFGRYAEIAVGRPPRADETDVSPMFYAQLLIFREFMHHLKFEQIVINRSAEAD